MKKFYLFALFCLPVGVLAQAPTITAISPAANKLAVARTSPISVTFSQPLTANSAAGLKVYSAQRGGLLTRANTTAIVNGNSLSFTPSSYQYAPGETVFATITTAVASNSGKLINPRVIQFTTAVQGTGRGQFLSGANCSVNAGPSDMVTGDVDRDGDLDLVIVNSYRAPGVQVLLNGGDATGSNTGEFTVGSTVAVSNDPERIAIGDVDGDGDLDIAVANSGGASVSVRLNGGDATGSSTGVFSKGQTVEFADNPKEVQLADIDNDGDLDLINVIVGGNISITLNGGDNTGSNTGIFGNGTSISVGYNPNGLAIGDVDGDGDLDLITANNNLGSNNKNGTLKVCLNGGNALGTGIGLFSNGSTIAVGDTPNDVTIGDVDGDGDLDLVAPNFNSGTVSIRLNGGDATGSNTGSFSAGSNVAVGSFPLRVILGDVDADGDLDLAVSNSIISSATVRLNGGDALGSNTGVFSNGSTIAVGNTPTGIKLADIDGDSDLDLVIADNRANTIETRLNGGKQVLAVQVVKTGLQIDFVVAPTILINNTVFYTYNGPVLTSESKLSICSLAGQCVWESTIDIATTGALHIGSLASGWYIVRLVTANHNYTSRFYRP
jgi:hypothetical protein